MIRKLEISFLKLDDFRRILFWQNGMKGGQTIMKGGGQSLQRFPGNSQVSRTRQCVAGLGMSRALLQPAGCKTQFQG
jgi:hypothetical protein